MCLHSSSIVIGYHSQTFQTAIPLPISAHITAFNLGIIMRMFPYHTYRMYIHIVCKYPCKHLCELWQTEPDPLSVIARVDANV